MYCALTSDTDYCVSKIKLLSSFLGAADLKLTEGVSAEEFSKLTSEKTSMVLVTDSGETLAQQTAILRYIAAAYPVFILLGSSSDGLAETQVNSWLEFSCDELEVPLQALITLRSSGAAAVSPEAASQIESKCKMDLNNNLSVLEEHLSTKTFLVGEKVTLADLVVFAVLHAILKAEVISAELPSLFRWFMTLGSESKVSSVTGDVSTVAVAGLKSSASGSSSSSGGLWDRGRTRVKELLKEGAAAIGKLVVLKGWIRTIRSIEHGDILFVELTDGSTVKGVQLVITVASVPNGNCVNEAGGAGASISITGTVVESPAKGQTIEVNVTTAEVLGAVYGNDDGSIGGKKYPLAKKQHTLEFLREKAHLRPRTKVFSAALRMRHAMAFATNQFFNDRGFVYVHTPLITAADCEGAGEQFAVTTLFPEHGKVKDIPITKDGSVDFTKDFFSRRCCLTVSGQLNVETHACALSDVYTFGPTFRAENSHTSRHLAEFWMIEPEICFAELIDDMALAEDYIKFCTNYALEHCADDLHYLENEFPAGEKGLVARLQNVVDNAFARITYTDAVKLLQDHVRAKTIKFKVYPNWGDDLGSEHERYLCEKVYERPTIVINYPKGIKAFYMKLNDDNETVAAMDILVPKIGELVGGSQREDNLKTLERRCVESGMKVEDIWWYADLRRYGSVPHAGFGLGFERLVMFVTGLENIRDVISFPRVPGHAEF